MSKKSIILFILEGESDYKSIGPYITDLINSCNLTLKVEIVRGDNTSKYKEIKIDNVKKTFAWNTSNITQELRNLIKIHLKQNSISPREIHSVYYVTDTDNCFNELLREERLNKSLCLKKLFYMKTIELSSNVISPIEVIFFARDLEEVTVGNTKSLTSNEKNKIALEFAHKSLTIPGYFDYIFRENDIKTWDTFTHSYSSIPTYSGKSSNMNNFLDKVKEFKEEKFNLITKEIEELKNIIDKNKNMSSIDLIKVEKDLKNKSFQLKKLNI